VLFANYSKNVFSLLFFFLGQNDVLEVGFAVTRPLHDFLNSTGIEFSERNVFLIVVGLVAMFLIFLGSFVWLALP
jgi:hypothetical protein